MLSLTRTRRPKSDEVSDPQQVDFDAGADQTGQADHHQRSAGELGEPAHRPGGDLGAGSADPDEQRGEPTDPEPDPHGVKPLKGPVEPGKAARRGMAGVDVREHHRGSRRGDHDQAEAQPRRGARPQRGDDGQQGHRGGRGAIEEPTREGAAQISPRDTPAS